MRKFTIWLTCLAIPVQAVVAQIDTARLDLDTLENGLQVMIYADSSLQMASTRLSFLAGAKFDRADQAGVAYLSHHLMQNELAAPRSFNRDPGTNNYLTGGQVSGTFTEDMSVYCQQFIPRELKLALALEARRLSPVQYASERIKSWRNAIVEQEKQGEGPGLKDKYQQFIRQSVFAPPYDRPLQGFADLLEASTNEEIKEFVKQHYTAKRATLIIVSPVPKDTVRELVNALFRGWPKGEDLLETGTWESIPPDSIRNDTFHTEELLLPIATYLFSLPAATDTAFREVCSVASLLFAGGDALVAAALRKRGLRIADTGFDLNSHSGGSIATFSVVPEPGEMIDSVTVHLDTLLSVFSKEKVPDRDYFRWRAEMEKKEMSYRQDPARIAAELMLLKISGFKPEDYARETVRLLLPSREKVRKIVGSCFTAKRKKVFIALNSGW